MASFDSKVIFTAFRVCHYRQTGQFIMYPPRIIIISAIICAALVLSACNNTETAIPDSRGEIARPAKIVAVLSDGISVLRTFPGTLEATKRADLAFRVGGQLIELPAQAGLAVKEGDLLARLDESDFQNTLKERQARYDLAKEKCANIA